MTVIRLRNGEVWVHNPMVLAQAEIDWLSTLGFVRCVVAPNRYHTTDLSWFARTFPQTQIACPNTYFNHGTELKDRVLFTTDVPYVTPCRELEFFVAPGVRLEESVVFHLQTRTLIVCDLMMNVKREGSWLRQTFYSFNNMGDCCAPTRALKWFLTSNKTELLKFVEQLAELNPRRIVVNHGEIYEGEGGNQIRTSFASLFR